MVKYDRACELDVDGYLTTGQDLSLEPMYLWIAISDYGVRVDFDWMRLRT